VVEGHDRYVTSCAFASGGSLLATCKPNPLIHQVITFLTRDRGAINKSTVHYFVPGSSDHTVKVWQLQGSLAYETATVEHMAVENLISKWSCEDVVNWLAEIGLGDLGHVFETNEISGEKLATLTDAVLLVDLSIGNNNTSNDFFSMNTKVN
jgi:WD40 repeat protein